MTADPPGRRRIIAFRGALLAGAVTVGAAIVVVVAVPDSSWGAAALIVRPTAIAAGLAAIVLAGALRSRAWAAGAPLVATLAPVAAPWFAGAWVVAGAGGLLAWTLAVAAIVRTRWPAGIEVLDRHRHRHAVAAGIAATVWLGGIAVALSSHALTGDAPHYLTIARSLVADGDLDLRDDYDHRDYADFYPGSLEPRHTNTSPWGEQYPFHGIGVAVLVAPAFAVFGVAGATATLVVLMAAASALLWLAAWHLLRDGSAAWFGWAALILAAPYALHAAAIYPDGPAAAAVAAALWLLVLLMRHAPMPLWQLATTGVGLAALPWLHARLALPAGVFGLAIVLAIWHGQPDRWSRIAWFLAVPIISLTAWIGSAQVMFGTWNPSAAILQRTAPGNMSDMARGLLGLLADHQYGLMPAAPVMVAAAAAAAGFIRAFPMLGLASVGATLGVLVVSSFWGWWGGDSAPARFLTVTLPAQALWLAWSWSRSGAGVRRVLTLALSITAAMTVLYASVDGGARAYAFADGHGSVFAAFSHSVDVSRALPSLFRQGETATVALIQAVVWLVATAAAAWLVARTPATSGEGAATGLGGLTLLVAAAIAASVGWRAAGAEPWTPGAAALALVQDAGQRGLAGIGIDSLRPRGVQGLIAGLRLRTPESVPLQPPVLLHVPDLPAGDYDVRTESAGTAPAALQVELGREAWPFARWALGDTPPSFSLPTALHSVRVLGSPPVGTTVWLAPRHLAAQPVPGMARRITRYGELAVASMDDDSYPEATGVWTGGNRSTRLLIAPTGVPPAAVAMRLESGAAAVEVSIATAAQSEMLRLPPQATGDVRLAWPDGSAAIDLRVNVRGGFPASAIGPATDARTLGVWLAFSAAPGR